MLDSRSFRLVVGVTGLLVSSLTPAFASTFDQTDLVSNVPGLAATTDPPSNGIDHPGTVVLDFNEAVNPPCAYSPFATCPLAPREARLPIAVPAGEKRYDK